DSLGPPEPALAELGLAAPRVGRALGEERLEVVVGDPRHRGLRVVLAAAQRWIGLAAPDRVVVLAVTAARRAVADVDEAAAVAEQHDAARLLDRARGPRIFLAGAGVDLALLRRAQQERIGEVAAADLLQQLGARRDRLRLERGRRCVGEHLRGHQAGEQLV